MGAKEKKSDKEKVKEEKKIEKVTPKVKEMKEEPLFSSEELASYGSLAFELQDDKIREICRGVVTLFAPPKITKDEKDGDNEASTTDDNSDLQQLVEQYELTVRQNEEEFKTMSQEIENLTEETKQMKERSKEFAEQRS